MIFESANGIIIWLIDNVQNEPHNRIFNMNRIEADKYPIYRSTTTNSISSIKDSSSRGLHTPEHNIVGREGILWDFNRKGW